MSASGGDFFEEIGLEHVSPLLKDYEILIKTLSEQLEFYKEEQTNLKSEIVTLLNENKLLSSSIKELLDSAQKTTNPIKHRYEESDYIQNLKSQINLLLQEKDSAIELWKNSLSTVDQLEEELRLFEGRTHGYVSKNEYKKMKLGYEKRITELEKELIKSKTSLLKIENSSKSVVELKEYELKQSTEAHEVLRKELEKLEENIRNLQEGKEEEMKMQKQLAQKLEEKNKVINELRIKDLEAKAKVTEAVQVVEVALMEKDSALLRESLAREELSKMSKALADAIDGKNEKFKMELEEAKRHYAENLLKIQNDMKILIDELRAKEVELEKHKNVTKVLEEELERIRRGVMTGDGKELSKFLSVEKSLESTFQKLLSSERRNVQLQADNSKLQEEMDRVKRDYKADVDKRDTERFELLNKIKTLENELNISSNNLLEMSGKLEGVNNKISQIEGELKKQLELKEQQSQNILSSKIKEIESENAKAKSELKQQLESHIRFNKKWKTEIRSITQSLEDHIHKLKTEAADLKRTNADLNRKLRKAQKQVVMYQEFLQQFCADISDVVASNNAPVATNREEN